MNTPDDYHQYWTTCEQCGMRTHPAEQPDCLCVICDICGELTPPNEMFDEEVCVRCNAEEL